MASVELPRSRPAWPGAGSSRDVSGWSGPDGVASGESYVALLPVARPWLSLYGARIRPVPGPEVLGTKDGTHSSLLHQSLPDELVFEVFRRVPSWSLGRAACVCRKWKYALRQPCLWRAACCKAWQVEGEKALSRVVCSAPYLGSWRLMWLTRPRLRFEGLYVSRNTYLRCGIVEWAVKNPVHMVCYFRYLRFFPSGKFYYKTSPQVVRDVAKTMHGGRHGGKGEGYQVGRYTLHNNEVQAAVMYPGLRPTVLRMRLRLRGTCEGANNRMDVEALVTSGLGEGEVPRDEEDDEVLARCHDWDAEESHHPDVPAVSHRRGTAPFVFVPFLQADTDILNLPVDKMDYYVPG